MWPGTGVEEDRLKKLADSIADTQDSRPNDAHHPYSTASERASGERKLSQQHPQRRGERCANSQDISGHIIGMQSPAKLRPRQRH
jgi:hypothetical protein